MMRKQVGLYVWSSMVCVTTLVAGEPQLDQVTETSVFNVDEALCQVFGADACNITSSSTTGSVDITPIECECVPFYLCDDNNTIIQDGRVVIDLRIKNEECNTYDQRCCAEHNIRPEENPVVEYSPGPNSQINSCGIRNKDGLGFRVIGTDKGEAQYGEFPWMVIVLQSSGQDEEASILYLCGGSLIHPQFVLTAAHCVKDKNNLVVRVGEYDVQSKSELYPTQNRKVRKTIIHEHFTNSSLINDLALLILEDSVDMTQQNVGLICLPEKDENMDGRECVASGWGKDKFDKGQYHVIMKKIDLPIVPRGQCLEALQRVKLGANFKLHSSFICAGGEPGKDTCKGDGGSPLVCPSKANPDVYVQAGIVAWGLSCGTETPAVYVNVPSFVPWIKRQLQEKLSSKL